MNASPNLLVGGRRRLTDPETQLIWPVRTTSSLVCPRLSGVQIMLVEQMLINSSVGD
jgi:hypothetical protein